VPGGGPEKAEREGALKPESPERMTDRMPPERLGLCLVLTRQRRRPAKHLIFNAKDYKETAIEGNWKKGGFYLWRRRK
jgi:hypothetical protein